MGNSESSSSSREQSQIQSASVSSGGNNVSAQPAVTATSSQGPNNTNAPAAPQPTGPGAYRMPGRPSNQRFYVTIPRGVKPGQHFAVLVNGQQMMVRCPEENRPGDRLIVAAPRQTAQQYVVSVPPNVRQGQQFRVMINNQEVMVTCPRGVKPGQRVTFQLPAQERVPQTAPNHQMFEVVVPEGVKPGQPFALIANGQRVMVSCPSNVKPGQKIRFQLPIQLSQQQLEAYKVNYDKDAWMRCLGSDLKYHWIFNKSSTTDTTESHLHTFEMYEYAYIRQILTPGLSPEEIQSFNGDDIKFIPAGQYAIDTTMKGTNVSYQEINSVASLPFQQKVDWVKNQFSAVRIPWEEGHIKIRVRRSHLLADALEAIESIELEDIRKIFRFEFINEPALDAGGVTREFYTLICEQLCNPGNGLFQYSAVNQMCMQFNHNSGIANEHHLKYFHMLGRILGKSLMDSQITPVHFVQPIYKHVMGWPIILKDLEHIDDQIYRNLMELLDIDDCSMLYLDFVTTEDHLGMTETVELVPGGTNISVTNDNLSEYLQAQLKYRLLKRINSQLCAFLKGFYDVVPEIILSVFDFQELELLLHGLPNINMDDWKNNTEYTGEFASSPMSHKVVQWFWEVVESFDMETKAKLLQFVTGTSGVPVQGFGFLQGNDCNIRKFTLHGDKNVKVFPRAHTCFNRIDVPIYKNKAEIQKFLTMAINMESTGFDIE